jgi:hypothetical protein
LDRTDDDMLWDGFNPLNAELNPICHLLALLGGATIVDVSRLRVKEDGNIWIVCQEDEGTDCEDGDSDTGW